MCQTGHISSHSPNATLGRELTIPGREFQNSRPNFSAITRKMKIVEIFLGDADFFRFYLHIAARHNENQTMNNQEIIREVINNRIANGCDGDTLAKLELCREFFTNPDFRKAMEEIVWEMNQA